jgi:hypothetical protein
MWLITKMNWTRRDFSLKLNKMTWPVSPTRNGLPLSLERSHTCLYLDEPFLQEAGVCMSQRRGTATDQLATVFQALQLGRKTGTLFVERGEGPTREEGSITFAHGQITQASAGQWEGEEALTWLRTWSMCRFLFVSSGSERANGTASPSGGSSPVPSRLWEVEEALLLLDRAGLSRAHRRLLLLIDGQRTIIELGYLMRRRPNEVLQLLRDLEWIGVIHQS